MMRSSRLVVEPSPGELVTEVVYIVPGADGSPPRYATLPVTVHRVHGFSTPRALVVTGDLQYFAAATSDTSPILLGVSLADTLASLAGSSVLPDTDHVAVVLTGDYYADPAGTMGASGPIDSVWSAFAQRFPWVVGVLGNHDQFESNSGLRHERSVQVMQTLDSTETVVGDLTIAGVGGIMGNPRRPGRRTQAEYLSEVMRMSARQPDVLVLHETPAIPEMRLRGSETLREHLEATPPLMVCCGHVHWTTPIVLLNSGTIVVNADMRCVVLIGAE